jgi:serine/threonine protein kinase
MLLYNHQANLRNGTEVAIKRLNKDCLNEKAKEDFLREVEVMSRFEHVNLVKLLYRCQEAHEWILVYEFMQNRSLDLHIFGTSFFN